MNTIENTTWWHRLDPGYRSFYAVLAVAWALVVMVEVIGAVEYGRPAGEAATRLLLALGLTGGAALAGIAYRRRRFMPAVLGLLALVAVDLGTWLALPFREAPLIPLTPKPYLIMAVAAVLYGWFWMRGKSGD